MHTLTIMSSAADCDTTCTSMQESNYTSASNVQESSNTIYASINSAIMCTTMQELQGSYTTVNKEITSSPMEESSNPVTNKISDTCHGTRNPVQESSSYTTVNNVEITCTPVEESSYIHNNEMICVMVTQSPWNGYHRPQESYATLN